MAMEMFSAFPTELQTSLHGREGKFTLKYFLVDVPGAFASSLYGAPSIAEQVSAETEQLPDFATHRPRMLWRML
jgi:hypothetical protein